MSGSVNIGTLSGVLAMRDEFSSQMAKFEARLKAVETSTQRASRTTRTETDKINDAYKKVAAALDPVVARTQRYEKQVDALNRALKAGIITKQQYYDQISKALVPLQSATHWTQRLGSSIRSELTGSFTRFFAISALITGTVGSIVSVTRQLVQANLDAEASSKRVEEAVRRYGSTSGVSVEQIDSLAQSISRLTGIDDELIADAETLALRFNRIHAEVFPRVTQAAVDMSVATGTDLSAAFEKVGKLVNQPLRALTLLAREGYAVSKSQSDMIKSLVAAGDIEKAQIEILKILEAQYGGAAAAARDTMGGALKALGTTWENFLERVGQDNMGPLRSALESLIKLLEIATDKVDDFTVGFHLSRIGVNLFVKEALEGIGRLVDLVTRAAPLFGLLGIAVSKLNKEGELSARMRAGAAAADRNIAQSSLAIFKVLGLIKDGHKSAAGAALEQTEAESKLNRELKAQADQISRILSEQSERIRFLFEQRELAAKGPGLDTFTRLKEEQRINDEHEYRVSLLRLQSQFGLVIGKQLADQERAIKELARKVKIELEISTKLLPIDISASINRQFDNSMSDFLDELKSTEEIARRNAEAFAEVGATYEEWLEDFAGGWKESFKSVREIADDEMASVREAVKEGLLTASEGERALAQIRSEVFDDVLSNASRVLGYLADEFGGFFEYLSQAVQVLQQAQQAKSDFSGLATSMGASSGVASAAGAFGAYLVIAKAMYDAFKAHNESRSMRRYDYAAVLGMGGPSMTYGWNTPVEGMAREASLQIKKTVEAFAESIGASIRTFADLEIQVRKDGKYFKAFIEGELVGQFESMQEAVSAAILGAFKSTATQLTGASDLVLEGLKKIASDMTSPMESMEEAADFLTKLREVAELNWSGMASDTLANIRHLDKLRQTLGELEQATPAVIQGLADLTMAEIRSWQAWSDSITGRERTPKEILEDKKREAALFEAQKKLRIAELEMKKIDLLAQAEYLKGKGKFGEIDGKIKQNDLKLAQEYLLGKATLFNAELSLNEKFLEAIAAQISAIETLIGELLKIPAIDIGKIKLPKGAGGTGGKDQVRDFIKDRKFELDLAGMSEWQRKLAELDKQYGPLIEQAGKDKKLREELLKLKERELDLLKKEQALSTVERLREFLGLITPFESVRKTASELIKQIEDSPFGSERKARMIGRVLAEVDRQLQAMSDEMSAGLLGDLAGMLDDGILKTDILRAQFVLNWQLQLADARARMAMLIAEGRLTDANRKLMEDAINILAGLDPSTLFGERGAGGTGSEGTASGLAYTSKMEKRAEAAQKAAEELSKALEDARNKLRKYTDDGVDPLTSKLIEIRDDFSQIRSVLGDTPEILDTFNRSVRRAVEEFIADIREFREGMDLSSLSTLTGEGQFYEAQSKFRSIKDAILAGDFSKIGELTGIAQQYGELGQRFTGGEGLRFIMKEIKDSLLAVETSTLGYAEKFTGASLGTSANPMMVSESPAMLRAVNDTTAAINNGNVLVLSELRESKAEQAAQTGLLYQISLKQATGTGVL